MHCAQILLKFKEGKTFLQHYLGEGFVTLLVHLTVNTQNFIDQILITNTDINYNYIEFEFHYVMLIVILSREEQT